MPKTNQLIASRFDHIEDSITLKISALAKKMKKDGIDVIGFGAGEPDFDTPDNIKNAAISAIQEGKTKYTVATGIPELKAAICTKFQSDNGLSYTPENISINVGAKHSIYNILQVLIDNGDEVLIPSPYWVSYPEQVRLAGGTPKIMQTTEETQYKITAKMLEAAITDNTKCLILNSPSNPTGMVYAPDELKALAEVVVQRNILVISDEIYEKLMYGDTPHVSIASFSDKIKEQTIVVNGVSKAYAMTGWRIGYLAASLPIATAIKKLQSHSTSNPTSIAQWAALEALIGPQEAVAEMQVQFNQRRHYMIDTLNSIPGIHCIEPEGAFYAFPNIASFFGKSCPSGRISSSADFCDFLLKEAKVACVPGSGFGEDHCMRLSYATGQEAIEKGLQRLKEWTASLT